MRKSFKRLKKKKQKRTAEKKGRDTKTSRKFVFLKKNCIKYYGEDWFDVIPSLEQKNSETIWGAKIKLLSCIVVEKC